MTGALIPYCMGKHIDNGINVGKIKKACMRRSLGIVLQDTNLFTGTVRENICCRSLDVTDEQVYNSTRLVCADSFIERLLNGYDT